MGKLVFYRQARADGGVRTGVDGDDTPLLHEFHRGSEELDPAILWYVDVEFEGDALPVDAEEARRWLVRRASGIAKSLRAVADDLSAGIDVGSWPVKRSLPDLPQGVLIRSHGLRATAAIRR